MTLAPDFPNVHFRLGLLWQKVDPDLAMAHYQQELTLRPDFWACRNNLALLLQKQGQAALARQMWQQCLQDCPATERAARAQLWENLADLEYVEGQVLAAQQALQEALALNPREVRLYHKLSQVSRQLGDLRAAERYLQQALNLQPAHPELWFRLAQWQASDLRFDSALHSLKQALHQQTLPRQRALYRLFQAHCHAEQGDLHAAQQALDQGLQEAPLDGLRLARACLLPPIYQDEADIRNWRNHVQQQLRQLAQQPLKITDPCAEVGSLPFYLPYHGENDRELMELLSALYQPLLPPEPHDCPVQEGFGSRLRIAVVSHFFHQHALMQSFAGTLEKLDREQFCLGLFALNPLLQDEVTAQLRQGADHWQILQGSLPEQVRQIRQWRADWVLFTDLGPYLPAWLLAHYRLAVRQAVLPLHPVTSGIRSLDGFLSHIHLDSPAHQSHYSEPLWRLSHLPFWLKAPHPEGPDPGRQGLGLPEQRRIYLCPVQLWKVHPAMDSVFAALLERDREGIILLLHRPQSHLDQILRRRFEQRIGPHHARIWFRSWLKPGHFMHLLKHCEVLLDTFPWGNGTTLLSALAAGIPVVSLKGAFARGRYAYACYAQMGLADWICHSPEAYVERALHWAKDKELRQALSTHLKAHQSRLFENPEMVQGFERFLLQNHPRSKQWHLKDRTNP